MSASDTMMKIRDRNRWITVFVILWLLVFHYESLRYSVLRPLLHRDLPKLPLLFPPAGWMMFFRVDASEGRAEVYGLQDGQPTLIDPHEIFRTRFVGYDNIRRNVLVSVLEPERAPAFCRYLASRFPAYPAFAVVYLQYPSVVEHPWRPQRYLVYRCAE